MKAKEQNKQRRIFIDTNVLVGAFRGIKEDVYALQYLFNMKDYECFTSALAIAQTISTCQGKKKNKQYKEVIIKYIDRLMHKINIIGLTKRNIEDAFLMENNDLEDNIQYNIGQSVKCYYYITNNVKDFNKYNSIYATNSKGIRAVGIEI